MKKKTQCDRILDYFHDFGSITQLEALHDLGCMRLSARIGDLKKQGYKFITKPEKDKNRYGEKISYSRYFLEQ